ncbi:hypothetical protein [Nocardiopsis alba]|uniref:hypothetical protein n=1 Tax=Nocardiopsis alba TaxID=53437 RepID=UPI0033AC1E9C
MNRWSELARSTGLPPSAFERWETAPAPAGMDPQLWADAQRTRAERARRWDEAALNRLPHYMHDALPKVVGQVEVDAAQAA